jgi:Fur family peroxide stress response transcriptional regulator
VGYRSLLATQSTTAQTDGMSDALPAADVVARLGERGLAASAQRVAVYAFISGMGERHLTAEELHRSLREDFPTLSRATVYNNLAALAEAGLIEKLDLPEGARFGRVPEPHVNLVCRSCGNISDVLVGDRAIRDLITRASTTAEFDAAGVSITMSGLCRRCRQIR